MPGDGMGGWKMRKRFEIASAKGRVMKKAEKQNTVEKKSIGEWLKARSPLLLNMELIAAVNKVFWENADRPLFGIADALRAAGFHANAMFYPDKGEFKKLLDNLYADVAAVREELFHYPESIRGKRGSSMRIKECDRGKESELIYFSLMLEKEFFEGYGTLLMIFRKPRTNWCTPVLVSCG